MTCKCISSETLAVWVDGALDAADARDVACHVAICATCQHNAALFRGEVDALRGALGRDKAPAQLWARISSQLAIEPVPPTRLKALSLRVRGASRHLRGAAVGVALAASVIAGVLMVQQMPGDRGMSNVSLATLAAESAEDYMTFQISQRALDVASDDPTDTLSWLGARVNGALPDIDENVADFRLVGGRLCWLMGQRLGALTYTKGTDTITVYVMPMPSGHDGAFSPHAAEQVTRQDGRMLRSVVWSGHGLAVAIVSALSDAETARFAKAFGQAMTNTYLEI